MLGRGMERDVAHVAKGSQTGIEAPLYAPAAARAARLVAPNKRSYNRAADVNIENHLPVFIVRQSAAQIPQTSLKARIRSRYAFIPGGK